MDDKDLPNFPEMKTFYQLTKELIENFAKACGTEPAQAAWDIAYIAKEIRGEYLLHKETTND